MKALNLMPQNTLGGTLIKTEAEVMRKQQNRDHLEKVPDLKVTKRTLNILMKQLEGDANQVYLKLKEEFGGKVIKIRDHKKMNEERVEKIKMHRVFFWFAYFSRIEDMLWFMETFNTWIGL